MTDIINDILKQIEHDHFISLTKDDSSERHKSLDKMRAYGLIEIHGKNSWHLTEAGYKAISLGGFDQWFTDNKSKDLSTIISGDNISFITGDSNLVNQSSLSSNSPQTIKTIPQTISKLTKKSITSRIWKLVSDNKLISGVILLLLSYLFTYLFFQ